MLMFVVTTATCTASASRLSLRLLTKQGNHLLSHRGEFSFAIIIIIISACCWFLDPGSEITECRSDVTYHSQLIIISSISIDLFSTQTAGRQWYQYVDHYQYNNASCFQSWLSWFINELINSVTSFQYNQYLSNVCFLDSLIDELLVWSIKHILIHIYIYIF